VHSTPFERSISDLRQKPILLSALLVLATLLLYAPVTHHDFLQFDDGPYVTQNPHVSTGLNRANVVWAFTSFHEANWHPVTWLSHMADCQLFGLNSGAQHFVNVVLHTANVFMLFFLLQKATGAVWRSTFVAALFAVHPLNVETVAWVAERKSLLCALFSLLTIAAYGWNVRRPDWRRYLLVVTTFAMALMSKPMAVTLPIVLLLLDYWPLQRYEDVPFLRKWTALTIEKLPLLLMSAASSVVTVFAQRSVGALIETSALPLFSRAQNAIVSYVAYIGKIFWPASLAVFYPYPDHSAPWPKVVISTAILAAITIAALYFRRSRYFGMGWFLFIITLIPVIGIVQVGNQAMADRYAYIPSIGLFIIMSWGLGEIADVNPTTWLAPTVAALCVILALAVTTVHYLRYWQNGVTLFTQARNVAGRPNPVIEEALADALRSSGQFDEAFQHYSTTCELRPDYAFCHYNMAEILYHRHQLQDALQQYQLAASLTNRRDIALSCFINSGEILLSLGDYRAADANLAVVLQIDPSNDTALRLRQQVFRQMSSREAE
jgi:protein O-mannosyl-transferase